MPIDPEMRKKMLARAQEIAKAQGNADPPKTGGKTPNGGARRIPLKDRTDVREGPHSTYSNKRKRPIPEVNKDLNSPAWGGKPAVKMPSEKMRDELARREEKSKAVGQAADTEMRDKVRARGDLDKSKQREFSSNRMRNNEYARLQRKHDQGVKASGVADRRAASEKARGIRDTEMAGKRAAREALHAKQFEKPSGMQSAARGLSKLHRISQPGGLAHLMDFAHGTHLMSPAELKEHRRSH